MKRIILHLGLHKTATKFYQHHVFPFLDKEKFNYNDPKFTQYIMDFLKAEEEDRDLLIENVLEAKKELLENDKRTIVVSREIMSGDLFSAYKDWDKQIDSLQAILGEAEIIISLRFQPNWLVSCYRESVHEHHYQTIEDFLCIDEDGEFRNPESKTNAAGFAQLYALNLDYSSMLKTLFSKFDRDKVLVLFFENLKNDKDAQIQKVLNFIDSKPVNVKPVDGIPNRGYSANSIQMSIDRYKKLTSANRENEIHRPIFFYGKNSIPAGNIELSLLDKEKYWGEYFLRDNQEVRSPNYPNLSNDEQKQLQASWRFRVKNIIDKEYYYDWDLLEKHRTELSRLYKEKNLLLEKLLPEIEIPKVYTD